MKSVWIIASAMWAGVAISPAAAEEPRTAEMYKPLQCGCCDGYADYLEQHGFKLKVESLADQPFETLKRMAGVPQELWGCHTLKIGGYIVEGLVPVNTLNKLLTEKPNIKGISLPGMPAAAPGMWGPKTGPLITYEIPQGSGEAPKEFARE